MGKRLLSTFGLPPSVIRNLQSAAFLYDEDVKGLTPSELVEGMWNKFLPPLD